MDQKTSKMDKIIVNGKVVSPEGVIRANILIKDGKVEAIAKDTFKIEADHIIDAKGAYVIPGAVDPEVHIVSRVGINKEVKSDPPQITGAWIVTEDKIKDYLTETEAAAHGGITCFTHWLLLHDEPYLPWIDPLIKAGNEMAYVDYSIYPVVTNEEQVLEMPEICKKGITQFKAYMLAPRGSKTEKHHHGGANLELMFRMGEKLADFGYPAIMQLHCEDSYMTEYLREKLKSQGKNDLRSTTESRPTTQEQYSLITAGLIALETGCRILPVHITSKRGVNAIKYLKDEGVKVVSETCPSRMIMPCFDEYYQERGIDPRLAVNWTPFRTPEEHEALWEGIANGSLDCIGSDHGSPNKEERLIGGSADYWTVKFPGNEFDLHLQLMFSEGVCKNRISIERMVEVISTCPAKALGFYPRKGALIPGADADIVVINPNKSKIVDEGDIVGRTDYTIYKGMELKGHPLDLVMVRGNIIVESGKTIGKPGTGQFTPYWVKG